MATTITTSSTVNITVVDDQMNETVFKINGTAAGGLSLARIRAIYAPMINGEYLYSRQGYKVTAVARASKVETAITKEDLE